VAASDAVEPPICAACGNVLWRYGCRHSRPGSCARCRAPIADVEALHGARLAGTALLRVVEQPRARGGRRKG
jgi:hypothetical protein